MYLGKYCTEDTTAYGSASSSCPWPPGWYVEISKHCTFHPTSFSAKGRDTGRKTLFSTKAARSRTCMQPDPRDGPRASSGPSHGGRSWKRSEEDGKDGNSSFTKGSLWPRHPAVRPCGILEGRYGCDPDSQRKPKEASGPAHSARAPAEPMEPQDPMSALPKWLIGPDPTQHGRHSPVALAEVCPLFLGDVASG